MSEGRGQKDEGRRMKAEGRSEGEGLSVVILHPSSFILHLSVFVHGEKV
jgi:hypothetical protein